MKLTPEQIPPDHSSESVNLMTLQSKFANIFIVQDTPISIKASAH